jgi:predicted enzyme related to lactoylglutathione lyase
VGEENRGRFLWYELLTTDPRRAEAFYTRLFAWDTQEWDAGDPPYTMFLASGQPIARVMKLPAPPDAAVQDGARPHWLPYVGTADVDATVAEAGRLGAKTCAPPREIPAVGRFAVLADPAGAMFAVYAPSQAPPRQADPQPGDFCWHELALTSDVEAAFGFYQALFGWQKLRNVDMGPGGPYVIYGREGRELGGMFKKPPEVPGPSFWCLYVRALDVKSKAEEANALGARIANGPMEVPGGDWIVQLLDPLGALIALHAPAVRPNG